MHYFYNRKFLSSFYKTSVSFVVVFNFKFNFIKIGSQESSENAVPFLYLNK